MRQTDAAVAPSIGSQKTSCKSLEWQFHEMGWGMAISWQLRDLCGSYRIATITPITAM